MKALVIEQCGTGICVNSTLRLMLSSGIKPLGAVDDGAVVTIGEAVAYISDDYHESLGRLMPVLELSMCASTALAMVKLTTGLRSYVYSSDLKELGEQAITPVASGGGGVIDDAGSFRGDEPVPVVKKFTHEPGGGGALIVRFTGDAGGLIDEVNKLRLMNYDGDVIIEADPLSVLKFRKTLRRLTPSVMGIVVKEFRKLCKLRIINADAVVNVFRCRHCWIDYVGQGQLRTCPRCGNRLVELVKSADRIRLMSIDALVAKAQGELANSKPMRPIILPLTWFTRRGKPQ